MKISLIGLSGCGKTSIYSTTFGGMTPSEVHNLGPTIMYEVRNHSYLGLEIGIFDFGGQLDYRKFYLENPKVLTGTSVLIFIIDLHQPESFNEANEYFEAIYDKIVSMGDKPRVYVLFHKYDTQSDYPADKLDENLKAAQNLPFINKTSPVTYKTSIYNQEELSNILREILIEDFEELKKGLESAEGHLKELKSRIIIGDMNGNVLSHNVPGFSTGLTLREDLRDFIISCDNIRENFFGNDSAEFSGSTVDKSLKVYILNYILCVLVIVDKGVSDPPEKMEELLNDLKIFAKLAIETSKEE